MKHFLVGVLIGLLALPQFATEMCTTTVTAAPGISGATLTANTVPKATGAATLGNSTITDDGTTVTVNTASKFLSTLSGGAAFNNFQTITGTLPAVTTNNTFGVALPITSAGSSAHAQAAFLSWLLAGYTGADTTASVYAINTTAGTAGSYYVPSNADALGNIAVFGESIATTAGANIGTYGLATNATGPTIGALGICDTGSLCVGATGVSLGGTIRNGGYFSLGATSASVSGSLVVDNAAVAAPLFVARDNTASLPTTGPTATFQILDGAIPQIGNGVLTSATMTAETQGNVRDAFHSYTWTNAQVAALAGTAGDITVATLPAKTQVHRALVVITGTAAGPTTVTVSCGDATAGTPFTNYVLASDAKVAANTVYGDAISGAETGASLFDATAKWIPAFLPSYTATTLVTCHFISTGANLSTTTGSTGRVILETSLLP